MLEGGVPIRVVTGKIYNLADDSRAVPPVRVGLLDAANIELHHWTFAAEQSELPSKNYTKFETRLTSPPIGTVSLRIGFAGDAPN